ncbi:MAG: hypothetical protein V7709_15790, partial [Halioglobus sp.]
VYGMPAKSTVVMILPSTLFVERLSHAAPTSSIDSAFTTGEAWKTLGLLGSATAPVERPQITTASVLVFNTFMTFSLTLVLVSGFLSHNFSRRQTGAVKVVRLCTSGSCMLVQHMSKA